MPEEYTQREQQLLDISKNILSEIWKARLEYIKKDYENNEEQYDNDLILKVEGLLFQWEKQHKGQADVLKYMVISPLNSGVITKSYEFQIALYGKELYADENPLCFYWTPEFIYKDVEEDMTAYREQVSRKIIRLRNDEVNEIRRRYVLCHSYIAMLYMNKIMKRIKEISNWKQQAGAETKILYGTYMEQMVEIGKGQEESI